MIVVCWLISKNSTCDNITIKRYEKVGYIDPCCGLDGFVYVFA